MQQIRFANEKTTFRAAITIKAELDISVLASLKSSILKKI